MATKPNLSSAPDITALTAWVEELVAASAARTKAGDDSITIATIGTAVSKAIVFPTPYPVGVVPVVVASSTSASVADTRFASVQTGTITNTGFTVWAKNTANTTAVALSWIALG